MYDMKDWEPGAEGNMIKYLNELPEHQVITIVLDGNGYWRTIVRLTQPERKEYKRKVRPKGWKPGDPYVEMA